jgi:hypothetical protein
MRDSAHQALALQQHRDLLAVQQLQLDDIQHNVTKGNSLLTSQLTGVSTDGDDKRHTKVPRKHGAGQRRMRIRLPYWLTNRTWTLAAYHSQGSWTVELHPEVWRPFEAPALDFIRTGDIANVKKALDTGQLSIWDSTRHPWEFLPSMNLLEGSIFHLSSRAGVVLILSQLAVYHGQTRLCDYLLSNVEHLRRDDQLRQAIMLLDFAPHHSTSLQAEILELLAGKYDMDVYIFGSSDDSSRSLRRLFYDLSEIIMSHQPIDLGKVSLEDRFNIAMKLRERSPADFFAIVSLRIDERLLAMTDEFCSTVLHWAAIHWSIGHLRSWSSARLMAYGDLIVNLIKMGSNVSAINGRGHSPLMCLFASDDLLDDWQYESYQIPNGLHPSQIVSSWGTLLNCAGVSLSEYVESENFLLSRLEYAIDWKWRGRMMELEGIAIGDRATLTMEVSTKELRTIWEIQSMPGSYMETTPNVRRLPWYPSSDDDPQVIWQLSDLRALKTPKSFQLSLDSIDDAEFDLGHILFGGTQDDHMHLAAVYRREQGRNRRIKDGIVNEKRSSSTPPATKRFVKNRRSIPTPRGPVGSTWNVHKCPQDFRWGFCKGGYGESYDMRAFCMAGCSGRPDYGAEIAAVFMSPKKTSMTPREKW